MNQIQGKVYKFGDNINTDIISPGQYMSKPISIQAEHCMEAIEQDFSKHFVKGSILVAGNNFGSGSSRETAQLVLKELGVSAIIAKSFARIFFRNCINLGIPVLTLQDYEIDSIGAEDKLSIDLKSGNIINCTSNETYKFAKLPEHLINLLNSGGLEKLLKIKD